MIQIINRKDGKKAKKTTIGSKFNKVQISYNSWGHLTIRLLQNNDPNEDTLIVFNQRVSSNVISFCRDQIKDVVFAGPNGIFDDLPF
jgi:hypothetical protein